MLASEVQRELSRRVDIAWAVAGFVALHRHDLPVDLRHAAQDLVRASGLPVDGPRDPEFGNAMASQLRQIAAFASHGNGSWSAADAATLCEQGQASRQVADWLVDRVVPAVGLDARLAGAPGAFLDVGVGVGELAIRLAGRLPAVRVVGLDVLDEPLALARQAVAAAGCADRVELRRLSVAALTDEHQYDLAWLPACLIEEATVLAALPRLHAALRPGGWLVTAILPPTALPTEQAINRLYALLVGGSAFVPDELAPRLRAAGFVEVTELPTTPLAGVLLGARRGDTTDQPKGT